MRTLDQQTGEDRSTGRRRRDRQVGLCAAALVCAAVGAAQGPSSLEFSFSNPGARAMGFGGAFAALADDATAAFANPAGLVQILDAEVSAEGRQWRYGIPYTRSGRVEGEPTGIGIDDSPGLRTGRSRAEISGLSFASVVYPAGRLTVAVYRHRLADFEWFFETQGLFSEGTDYAGVNRHLDTRMSFDMEASGTGLAGAWRMTETFSVGLGLIRYDGTLLTVTESYLIDEPTVDRLFAPNAYLPDRMTERTTMTMDGADVVVHGGFFWVVATGVNVGGFFRQGPEYGVRGITAAGPAAGDVPEGTILTEVETSVKLPDVFGLGVSYRPADQHLTLAAEWDRVRYSTILTSMARNGQWSPEAKIDDGDELHVGAEYAFYDSAPVVSLRLGAWLDPDHRIRSTEDDPYQRALLPGGDDEMHYAFGVGVAFERVQLDLGLDFSANADAAALSVIYSF